MARRAEAGGLSASHNQAVKSQGHPLPERIVTLPPEMSYIRQALIGGVAYGS